MKAKSFLNLSSQECLFVYSQIIDNGNSLLETSKIIGANGKYGPAISLSILGIEEWIKGTVLMLKGHGVRITDVPELKCALTGNHRIRHETASLFETMNFLLNIPNKFSKQNIVSAVSRLIDGSESIENVFNNFLGTMPFENMEWWSDADDFKNRGFYVDFKDAVISPLTVTESEFKRATKVVDDMLTSLRFIHSKFDDKHLVKDVVKLINEGFDLRKSYKGYITDARYEGETHPWPEYIPVGATGLLLGTFPTKKSKRAFEFFYPNASNRFWKVLAKIAEVPLQYFSNDEAVVERKRILDELKLGISDTGYKVFRQNESSLDSNLFPTKLTDVFSILAKYPTIETIILTSSSKGNSALTWFQAYCELNDVNLKIARRGPLPRMSTITVLDRTIKVIAVNSPSRAAKIKDDAIYEMYLQILSSS